LCSKQTRSTHLGALVAESQSDHGGSAAWRQRLRQERREVAEAPHHRPREAQRELELGARGARRRRLFFGHRRREEGGHGGHIGGQEDGGGPPADAECEQLSKLDGKVEEGAASWTRRGTTQRGLVRVPAVGGVQDLQGSGSRRSAGSVANNVRHNRWRSMTSTPRRH
jgi:hypothetical protein